MTPPETFIHKTRLGSYGVGKVASLCPGVWTAGPAHPWSDPVPGSAIALSLAERVCFGGRPVALAQHHSLVQQFPEKFPEKGKFVHVFQPFLFTVGENHSRKDPRKIPLKQSTETSCKWLRG